MASKLTRQIQDICEALPDDAVFSSTEGQAFVYLPIAECHQVFPLHDPIVRDWLTDRYVKTHAAPPDEPALRQAIAVLRARAYFRPGRAKVGLRITQSTPASPIYIDLANNAGESVEITPDGWRVTTFTPGATLRSARGQLPLPRPEPASSSITGPPSDTEAPQDIPALLLSAPVRRWLLHAMRPTGPYPILIIYGRPGTGKTTLARMLRALVDPVTAPLYALPSRRQEIEKLACRHRVLAFDHVTRMSNSAADALCRIASGAGIEVPEPGEHRETLMLDIARPVILTTPRNGVGDWQPRPDVASRALAVELPELAQPRPQHEIDAEFEKHRPRLLAMLYTDLCSQWDNHPILDSTPVDLHHASAAADPLFQAVRKFSTANNAWTGTATDLLGEICVSLTPRALSQRLHLIAATLELHGTAVSFERKHGGIRHITLTTTRDVCRQNAQLYPPYGPPDTQTPGIAPGIAGIVPDISRPVSSPGCQFP